MRLRRSPCSARLSRGSLGTSAGSRGSSKTRPGRSSSSRRSRLTHFVRTYLIPASGFVGVNYGMDLLGHGWVHLDYADYGDGTLTDEEFAKAERERDQSKVVTRADRGAERWKREMTEAHAVMFNLDHVMEILRNGIRRADVFMGIGLNAARTDPAISHVRPITSTISIGETSSHAGREGARGGGVWQMGAR